MRKARHNKLYNYLVNEFGISKELVWEAIKIRIDECFASYTESELYCRVENYIESVVKERVNRYYDNTIKEYISKKLDDAIKKQIDKQIKNAKFSANLKLEITPDLKIKVETPFEKVMREVKEEKVKKEKKK